MRTGLNVFEKIVGRIRNVTLGGSLFQVVIPPTEWIGMGVAMVVEYSLLI